MKTTQGSLFALSLFVLGTVQQSEIVQSDKILCDVPMKDAVFDIDMVVSKTWRIYYTWNWIFANPSKCVDVTFKVATAEITSRVYNEMADYMRSQPPWESATLLMTLGKEEHELLLFADLQGPAGRFRAVPNIVRHSVNLTPQRGAVPLLQFYIQLINDGQFLVMVDCEIGVGTLSASSHEVPSRVDVGQAAAVLDFGKGNMVCTDETRPGEMFAQE